MSAELRPSRPEAVTSRRRRRRGPSMAALALLMLIAGAHWAFHYRPRVRGLAAGDNSRVAALWASPAAETAAWLAYPHQNLAVLERSTGDLDAYLADLGIVLGDEALRVPRFGPFRFPPARDLVAVEIGQDPQWRGAAEVYPLAAMAARVAGRLTGNVWLGGGEVGSGAGRVSVDWHGNLWQFGAFEPGSAPSSLGNSDDTIVARLRIEGPLGRWPAGDFELLADDGSLLLVRRGSAVREQVSAAASAGNQMPLVLHETTDSGRRALLFFGGHEGGLPAAASVARGVERWDLPGERLLIRLGADVVETTHGGWIVATWSQHEQQLAASRIVELTPSTALGVSARMVAGPVAELASGIGETLEGVPIIGESEARYWLALSRLLRPLGEDGVVELSLAEPVFVRVSREP